MLENCNNLLNTFGSSKVKINLVSYYIMIRTIHADFDHLTPKCRQDLKLSGRLEFDSLIIMVSL